METYFNHPLGMVSYVVRFLQILSSIIVLGITAWAVRGTTSLSVIFSLTIATVTIVLAAVSFFVSYMLRRRRGHIFPMFVTDMVLSYLWLTSFIFLALNFNQHSCRRNTWNGEIVCSRQYAAEAFSFIAFFATLLTVSLEVAYIHTSNKSSVQVAASEPMPRESMTENLNSAGVAVT